MLSLSLLSAQLVALTKNWQWEGGNSDVGVLLVRHTGVGVVVGNEGNHDTDDTTGSGAAGARSQFADGQEKEGNSQEEEEREEGQGGFHCAESQHEGEDAPGQEIEADCVSQLSWIVVTGTDVEPRNVDGTEGHPEATVRTQGDRTEGVFDGHFPHTGQQLDETTVEHGEPDDDGVVGDTHGLCVNQGEDEGGGGEGAQPQRSRVGELVHRRSGQTWVQSTTECGHQLVLQELLVAQVDVVTVVRG